MARFLRPDVLDRIIGDRLRGLDARSTVEHLWNVFVRCTNRTQHPVEPLMSAGGGDFAVASTVSGRPRTYKIFHEFVFPELKPPAAVGGKKLWALLDQLNRY